MLMKDPPLEIVDGFLMLGTNEYIIYLAGSGDEAVVFEGGVGAVGPVVAEQIGELGIAGDLVRQIVITHAHPDHVMAVPKFLEVFANAKVCASEAAAGTMQREKAIGFFSKIDGFKNVIVGRLDDMQHGQAELDKRITLAEAEHKHIKEKVEKHAKKITLMGHISRPPTYPGNE